MGNKTATPILMIALVAALAACTSAGNDTVDPNILPTNYKQEILDTMARELVDPTNVRDAFVTEPMLRGAAKEQRYTVCVRYNARNANRQYAGSAERIGYFYGGSLNQLIEATREQCGNAPYKPFPELEKLCLATKCE